MQLLYDLKEKEKVLEIERGSTRSHPVENSLWKRLRTCRKTDYRMKRLRTCRKTDCRMNELKHKTRITYCMCTKSVLLLPTYSLVI
jgi:hypothetical protein